MMGCLFLGCGGNAGAHPTVPGAAICGGRRNQHFLVRRQVEVAGTFTTFTLFFFFPSASLKLFLFALFLVGPWWQQP